MLPKRLVLRFSCRRDAASNCHTFYRMSLGRDPHALELFSSSRPRVAGFTEAIWHLHARGLAACQMAPQPDHPEVRRKSCYSTTVTKPYPPFLESAPMWTLLLIILVLMAVGSTPAWPYARNWGYGPSGILGTLLLILVVLMLFQVVPFGFGPGPVAVGP